MIPQMKELVNNYKPEIIFSDGEWDYDLVHNQQGIGDEADHPWKSPNRPKSENLFFTRKEESVYIILKKWSKTPIVLTGLKGAGKIELLGYPEALNSKYQHGQLTITLPPLTVDELPSEHAWVIKVSDFRE